MMVYKYVIKNVARRHGKTVTFMPKPLFGILLDPRVAPRPLGGTQPCALSRNPVGIEKDR